MTFDAFAALETQGEDVTVHNVQLLDVQPDEHGRELLTLEHSGCTRTLPGGGRWSPDASRRSVGKFGYIVGARKYNREVPAGACYFRTYIDQSLRRVPELDAGRPAVSDGRAAEVVGWCCSKHPRGFRAPIGVVPGEGGGFVPDRTVAITVRVPPEFVRECDRVQMAPDELLRSFAGDLAGIQSLVECPRADGYGSNGSDERGLAEEWLERAHGMNAVDLQALDQKRYEAEEKQFQRDDFALFLDEFEEAGGQADDLIEAVRDLVQKQAGAAGA